MRNQEKTVTYFENSLNLGIRTNPNASIKSFRTEGMTGRFDFVHAADEFE